MRATAKIQLLFDTQQRGWYAEIFDRRGTLLHTTLVSSEKTDAFATAKVWLKERQTTKAKGEK